MVTDWPVKESKQSRTPVQVLVWMSGWVAETLIGIEKSGRTAGCWVGACGIGWTLRSETDVVFDIVKMAANTEKYLGRIQHRGIELTTEYWKDGQNGRKEGGHQ